ncbi:hypothetical protein Tsubulata_017921 [Turnera subulata]|uniref:Late embryogenesis abundant protein LEA-2 subgroup domain-containing protein n=1 Tax=Turnera subulata TaxID=218843 RepID=A0A9Q0F2K4_9ROSI|nr:hypothetical protein Tsubulata_017921 [Turnera subulata]
MAEHQRIHPVNQEEQEDVEAAAALQASPTVPLVPRGTSKSDHHNHKPADDVPVVQQQYSSYPPFQRTFPVSHSKPPKRRRSCCCKCLCWTVSLLLLLILVVAIIAGVLFLVFRPKLPSYSIDSMQITQFNPTDNTTTFDVTITARNPNKNIGIYYEGGSRITVWYTSTKLCQGSLPKFYQGHRNTTVLDVALTGQTSDANGLITTLQQTATIPLNLRVNQPVRVKLGKLKLFKVKFLVRCRLDVDSLSSSNAIHIKNSSCKFRVRL